ncbi:hypothetical protein HQ529_05670 [Candidatus Woesearchaeota archaeon]|nr:hypothetical protein [Candidatus Woesearchaeota archaeon]
MRRVFDARIRKVGNSYVVTMPSIIIRRFKLKQGDFLTVSVDLKKIQREFDSRIRKVGNSYVITIPPVTVKRFGLKEGSFITVDVELEKHAK